MNLHRNARLTPRGRRLLAERVCRGHIPLKHAAEAAGISTRTASKWVARYRREGTAGLEDRSSAPRCVPGRTSEERVTAIAALRRLRMTAAEISETLEMPLSTVSAVLLRIGLGKRSRLEPLEPANRYQRERPGELVHIDVKKLGRIDRVGHRITGRRASAHARGLWHDGKRLIGWDYSTSASTTPPAWPTPRYSPTRRATPWPAFCGARSLSTHLTASMSNAS
jgi:transposase